jgi:hypothetical protein
LDLISIQHVDNAHDLWLINSMTGWMADERIPLQAPKQFNNTLDRLKSIGCAIEKGMPVSFQVRSLVTWRAALNRIFLPAS